MSNITFIKVENDMPGIVGISIPVYLSWSVWIDCIQSSNIKGQEGTDCETPKMNVRLWDLIRAAASSIRAKPLADAWEVSLSRIPNTIGYVEPEDIILHAALVPTRPDFPDVSLIIVTEEDVMTAISNRMNHDPQDNIYSERSAVESKLMLVDEGMTKQIGFQQVVMISQEVWNKYVRWDGPPREGANMADRMMKILHALLTSVTAEPDQSLHLIPLVTTTNMSSGAVNEEIVLSAQLSDGHEYGIEKSIILILTEEEMLG